MFQADKADATHQTHSSIKATFNISTVGRVTTFEAQTFI
jgi:hypothetical protein